MSPIEIYELLGPILDLSMDVRISHRFADGYRRQDPDKRWCLPLEVPGRMRFVFSNHGTGYQSIETPLNATEAESRAAARAMIALGEVNHPPNTLGDRAWRYLAAELGLEDIPDDRKAFVAAYSRRVPVIALAAGGAILYYLRLVDGAYVLEPIEALGLERSWLQHINEALQEIDR